MPRYGSIKQRKLLILFRMGNLPVGGGFLSRELPGQKLLFQPHVIKYLARFSTTPIFFRCSNERWELLRLFTIRMADFGPMPGTRRRSAYSAVLISTGNSSIWRSAQSHFGSSCA